MLKVVSLKQLFFSYTEFLQKFDSTVIEDEVQKRLASKSFKEETCKVEKGLGLIHNILFEAQNEVYIRR